jgi:hypothetical protein
MELPQEKSAPPYISFTTFVGLLDKMREGIVPRKLDPTYLKSYAGGLRPKILHAFRWLGLTDKDNVVQGSLRELVGKPEDRPDLLKALLTERYPWAINLPLDATEQDLLDAFKDGTGIEGETRRKAITFFLNAAEAAKLEISPLFKKSRGRPAGGGSPRRATSKRVAGKKKVEEPSPNGAAGGGVPSKRPQSKEEMAAAYFQMLLDKATSGQKLDPELANRMERVIGLPSADRGVSQAMRKALPPNRSTPAPTEEQL